MNCEIILKDAHGNNFYGENMYLYIVKPVLINKLFRCFSISQSIIAKQMTYKVHMEGTVNGHAFEVKGEGEGQPYE